MVSRPLSMFAACGVCLPVVTFCLCHQPPPHFDEVSTSVGGSIEECAHAHLLAGRSDLDPGCREE